MNLALPVLIHSNSQDFGAPFYFLAYINLTQKGKQEKIRLDLLKNSEIVDFAKNFKDFEKPTDLHPTKIIADIQTDLGDFLLFLQRNILNPLLINFVNEFQDNQLYLLEYLGQAWQQKSLNPLKSEVRIITHWLLMIA